MRILIIEDEHKIANALKRGLEHETFAVDVSYDGDEGLAFATTETYDLIILDRMLPGQDGMEICRQLRQAKNHTPIIMLTAKDQVADRVAGLNAGADDYLIKPFAFEELLARVHALLRRPQEAEATALQVTDLTLNPITFEVSRAGRDIALSRKEFSLLHFLMRNAGIVVSKDTIISHVWDFDADILPNTVEVYVGYLRQKVDKSFPKKPALIQTVRGFGYRLGKKRPVSVMVPVLRRWWASPVFRLSLVYWAILAAISIGFSGLLYSTASQELERELRHPVNLQQIGLPGEFNFNQFRDDRLQESRNRLQTNLLILNLATIVLAGGISYYAARRTIRPIQTALEAQTRFASDASHELRTPLAAMRTEIEVALRDPDTKKAELREILSSNLEETNRLQELIESLLLLARQTQKPVDPEAVALPTMVHAAIERTKKAAGHKQLTIQSSVAETTILGNRAALTELVVVLLDNAIKFSPAGETVEITGQVQANRYELQVRDHGPGIPPDQQRRIFERFYQADRSRNNKGYGIGLALAAAVSKQHGGRITVQSTPGDGASFQVSLPLAATPPKQSASLGKA